ncbi:MAG TPA: tetratricopeptide repeat protein, partial [Nitrososphaerales archaeon]|nr:tetratricopeptide repeat protein [Nitrososphaerales archaeon]
VKGLKVIARTSVMNYKKKEKNVSQIGRELAAGSIIEGSVRKAGNRIRVTVQLIDSRTEEHLWATNYDKELDDIFAIQSDVAEKVAGSVSAGLLRAPTKEPTVDVEAYTMYIKAVQLTHEGTEHGMREAVSLLEKAIARDGGFTRAYAALGNTWASLATGGYENYSVSELKAEPLIKRALELDPESAEANAAMAHVCSVLDRFDLLRIHGQRAISINPNLAEAYTYLGVDASSMLRLEEGMGYLEKAHELDPLETYTADLLARVARVAGKNERALAVLQRMDQLTPSNPRIINGLAESYMVAGDFQKAQELLTRGFEVSPREPLLRVNQGLLFALTGRSKEAESVMASLERDGVDAVKNYGRLFINAALGRFDEAFGALDRAADMHAWPFLVGSLPIFTELRKDPRYAEFAKRVGIPAKAPSSA